MKPVNYLCICQGTLVEVGFEKECNKQMVTVCEPTYPRHHGYSYQQGRAYFNQLINLRISRTFY